MRFLMVVWACSFALSAQVAPPDAAAKLRQFEQNLANAMKEASVVSLPKTQFQAAAPRVCAIPLLQVRPDAAFRSNMPVIAPDPRFGFAAREVIPPAPVCGEQDKK
jgi:hypothetical protein